MLAENETRILWKVYSLKITTRRSKHADRRPLVWTHTYLTVSKLWYYLPSTLAKLRGCADKSLARPEMKQATATKPGIYSTYSPRSSIHFLARCSNFCKTLKKNSEGCPSSQVSVAAMTSASDEKWRTFNCFFQFREQVVVRQGQIRRIGWVIKTLEAKVDRL